MTTEIKHTLDWIDALLADREERGNKRTLRNVPAYEVNFSSNDVLGLSRHPSLKERAIAYVERYGTGATASRLVCGNLAPYTTIESSLAQLMDSEASLIFNSGYQLNLSLIPTLVDRTSTIFIDRYAHNSLLQGSLLSRAQLVRFAHNDLEHLETLLQKSTSGRKLVVTESLFSMDGDCSDLDRLEFLCERHNAMLYVDDAHAFGVYGPHGAGLTAGRRHITCRVVGFGKAAGAFGGGVCCSEKLRDYFVNYAGGLIYSTALPPAALGAVEASLELIPSLHTERHQVYTLTSFLLAQLGELGWNTGPSTSHIIPLRVGDADATMRLARKLEERGILAIAIRAPTVPEGEARLRISLSADHTLQNCYFLLNELQANARSAMQMAYGNPSESSRDSGAAAGIRKPERE